ncbi:MAG: hypothetical protein QOH46_3793 [Solirubrobacteraceae bacterium]|nr:hypothetical protein [Solirubrobacteraceae bacterium]
MPLMKTLARVGPPPELALGGATTRWTMPDIGISRFYLALEVHVREHGLEGYFEYNTDLFAPETIVALALDFEALLEHVVGAADTRVLAIPLRAAAERPAPDADIRSFRRRRGSLPAG